MFNPEYLLDTIVDNRYRLTHFIGRGSFGWVYEAAEELDGELLGRVAIKILSPDDEEQRSHTLKEIRGLSQLRHENVIAYMSSGSIQKGVISGSLFLATELGETSLQEQIEARKMKEETVIQMTTCIAKALSYIHQSGAVHRDVKPANIFRLRNVWKLADFGLARSVKGSITKASGQRGTLAYISPELIEDSSIGPVSDVYSLGVTILESLTGRVAHEGTTEGEFIKNLIQREASIPEELDPWWKGVLERCLEKEPRKRISSDDLLEYLRKGIEEKDKTKKSVRGTKEESKKENSFREKKIYSSRDRTSHSVAGIVFYMRLAPASTFPTGIGDNGSATVDHNFWIAETQVTYELWYEVRMWALDNGGYTLDNAGKEGSHGKGQYPSDRKKEPVTNVNWYDSIVWCNALSEYLGYDPVYRISGDVIKSSMGRNHTDVVDEDRDGFRLPTSMEWELAARYRGGANSHLAIEFPEKSGNYWTQGIYASGATNNIHNEVATKKVANFGDSFLGYFSINNTKTINVGSLCGNSMGLYDMSGNVKEWCFSRWKNRRITRGGGWIGGEELAVGHIETGYMAIAISNDLGFRVSKDQ